MNSAALEVDDEMEDVEQFRRRARDWIRANLQHADTTSFVHLEMTDEEEMASRAGLSYFQIPMTTRKVPTEAQLDEFLRIVNDPAHQPVYVHCVGGKHRTGVMTAAYRMTSDGWTDGRPAAP